MGEGGSSLDYITTAARKLGATSTATRVRHFFYSDMVIMASYLGPEGIHRNTAGRTPPY